jgi:hypothetical protein
LNTRRVSDSAGVPRDEVLLKLADGARSIGEVKRDLTRQSTALTKTHSNKKIPPAEITLPPEFTTATALPRADDDGDSTSRAVLLTGATGFIGGFVVAELLRKGHHVICLVRNAGCGNAFSSRFCLYEI